MRQFSRGVGGLLALSLFLGMAAVCSAAEGEESASSPAREGRPVAAGELPASVARLPLVWIDVLDAVPYAFPRASREASDILADGGVAATWVHGDSSTVTTEGELKIVLMPGAANGARLPEHVMGGTRRGLQSRTTWVYVSNVMWALGLKAQAVAELSEEQKDEVSRALGKVIAHEVIHAVAPDLPHSGRGLMSGTLGRNFLLQARVSLQPVERRALRTGVLAFAPDDTAASAVTLVSAQR